MTVTDNNIEYCNNLCGCDQVRISDVFDDGTSQLITRVCGSTIPDVIWTTSDKAQVTFMSDLLYSDRGFSMIIEEAFPGKKKQQLYYNKLWTLRFYGGGLSVLLTTKKHYFFDREPTNVITKTSFYSENNNKLKYGR